MSTVGFQADVFDAQGFALFEDAFQGNAFEADGFQTTQARRRAPGQPIKIPGRRFRAIFNGQAIEFESLSALTRAVAEFEEAARADAAEQARELAERQPKRKARRIAERVAPRVGLLKADADAALAEQLEAANRRIREAYEAELRVQQVLLNAKFIIALQADEDDAVAVLLEG